MATIVGDLQARAEQGLRLAGRQERGPVVAERGLAGDAAGDTTVIHNVRGLIMHEGKLWACGCSVLLYTCRLARRYRQRSNSKETKLTHLALAGSSPRGLLLAPSPSPEPGARADLWAVHLLVRCLDGLSMAARYIVRPRRR